MLVFLLMKTELTNGFGKMYLSIAYDSANGWVYNNWTGYQTYVGIAAVSPAARSSWPVAYPATCVRSCPHPPPASSCFVSPAAYRGRFPA